MNTSRAAVICILAMLSSACISAESREAVRLLQDIEAGHGGSELKSGTPTPYRETLTIPADGRRTRADLYWPQTEMRARLVLVHGFTPDGKDDPRLTALAESLARVGFLVLAPDLPDSRATRVSQADARRIADATVHLADMEVAAGPDGAPGIFAISYAVGLAVLATTEPRAKQRFGFVVSLGGYYDTKAVIRFITTGRHFDPLRDRWLRAEPNPLSKWIFLSANLHVLEHAADRRTLDEIARRKRVDENADIGALAARLGPEGRAFLDLLRNRESGRVEALIAKLPPAVRRQMNRLSPASYDLSHLSDKLILIHGRDDELIPWTQSVAFARTVPGSELFLIPGFSHITPTDVGPMGRLALIDATQSVLSRRR
jgi:pimeloyl-ACP methyl ester carboxylesterase